MNADPQHLTISLANVERVFSLIENKHKLILEWKALKIDNEEEYNRERISRGALRIRQAELDLKIAKTMLEIEADLKELNIQIEREEVK